MKEEVVKANVEEAGVDYSDDLNSPFDDLNNPYDDDDLDLGPQRKTFYQSHIFPMHMLQSLKVLISHEKVFTNFFGTGWRRDQHLCQEGEVYKWTNVS